MKQNNIMSHVVAGFPSKDGCVKLLLKMQAVGVRAIEIQIPFSDTVADGGEIMYANEIALKNKTTVDRCFMTLKIAQDQGYITPTYIMCYLQKIYHFGIDSFCKISQEHGVKGLIIPDVPIDSPEYSELFIACEKYQIDLVPVLTPRMNDMRKQLYLNGNPDLVYVTSMRGITGKKFQSSQQLAQFVDGIRQVSDCLVAVGFGVRSYEDAAIIMEFADIAVVGSEVIKSLRMGGMQPAVDSLKRIIG